MDASRSAHRRSDVGEAASADASEAHYSETFAEETMHEASSAVAAGNTNALSASRQASGSMYSDSFPQESVQSAPQKKPASPQGSGSMYSDSFPEETQQEASSAALVAGRTSKSPSHSPSKSASENQYSDDDFEDDPEDVGNDGVGDHGPRGHIMDMSQLQVATFSRSPSPSPDPSGRATDSPHMQEAVATSRSPSPSGGSKPERRQEEESPGDPRGRIMDMSELMAAVAPPNRAEVAAQNDSAPQPSHVHPTAPCLALSGGDATRLPGATSSVTVRDHCELAKQRTNSRSDSHPGNATSAAVVALNALTSPPAVVSVDASTSPRMHDFSELARLGLPMPPASSLIQGGLAAAPGASLPPVSSDRRHDAVPRHLKAHAWDLASLGQPGYPELIHRRPAAGTSDAQHRPQPPLAPGAMELRGGGTRGFGGEQGPLASGVERQLVERLAQRYVLDRKAPSLEQRERLAYRDMMQQVAWTALEPSAAQEAALLLSKRWLAPVSSTEALRAFRRSLHAVLTDDRVIDVVEHQMAAHFGGRHQAPAR